MRGDVHGPGLRSLCSQNFVCRRISDKQPGIRQNPAQSLDFHLDEGSLRIGNSQDEGISGRNRLFVLAYRVNAGARRVRNRMGIDQVRSAVMQSVKWQVMQ